MTMNWGNGAMAMTMRAATVLLLGFAGPALAAPPAASAATPAIERLADDLSDCPDTPVAQTQPDGSAPTVACTRQWVKGTVVRQDIAMTFLKGSTQLTGSAKATLDRFARALTRISSYRPFTIEGHTDSSGSRALNQTLSRARAQSVVDYLSSRGVDRARMTARGYGFDRPLPGRGAADPANRRVEVVAR